MFRIGIDLGGTKIEGVVLDPAGREIFRKRIATEREHGYGHILNRLKLLHDELVGQCFRPADDVWHRHARGHFPAHRFAEKFQYRLYERPAGEGRPGEIAGP